MQSRAITITRGFYFEVTLCEGGSNSAVGWADVLWSADVNHGVGEPSACGRGKSWAFHFAKGMICESECGVASETERAFVSEPGDIVSCECDLSDAARPKLEFRVIGSRASNVTDSTFRVLIHKTYDMQPSDPTCGLVPMISIDGRTTLLVNLGERPFAYAPVGEGVFPTHKSSAASALLPVRAWAQMRREEQAMLEAGPTFATLQPFDGPNSMQLDKDGTAVTTQYAKEKKIVPSVVFQGICLTSGVWYYEVELLQEGNLHRSKIGWADPRFSCKGTENIGVGDDKHSWSYCPQPDDGNRDYKKESGHDGGLRCHNGERFFFGKPWRYGGIVGVGVDVDRGQVFFSYNGNWTGNKAKNQQLGLAFDNIDFRGGIMPAATICGLCGQQVQFNFGDKAFKYDPRREPKESDCPIKQALPVWRWVTAYRPNQPKWYVMPSVVGGGALPTSLTSLAGVEDADESRGGVNGDGAPAQPEDCPCGVRHKGSFNGFPKRGAQAKESFGAPASLVPTSGAGVLRLEKVKHAEGNERIAQATHGRPSAMLRQLAPALPFVDGRRYYEVRVKEVERHASGGAGWRVGWASRGFVGDWSRDVGVGDDKKSVGISCVLNRTAMSALLFGGPQKTCEPLVVHPSSETDKRGEQGPHGKHVCKIGGLEEPEHGVGWQPLETNDKHCAHIVIKFERPSLLVRIAGVNVSATACAIDYCLVKSGEPHPPADAANGEEGSGWKELHKLETIERHKAFLWPKPKPKRGGGGGHTSEDLSGERTIEEVDGVDTSMVNFQALRSDVGDDPDDFRRRRADLFSGEHSEAMEAAMKHIKREIEARRGGGAAGGDGDDAGGDADGDTAGGRTCLASHVRLTIQGKEGSKPSWAQLHAFGLAAPPELPAWEENPQPFALATSHEQSSERELLPHEQWAKRELEALTRAREYGDPNDVNGAVCLAHAFGSMPPPAHPMPVWKKDDILCLAIDVPLRTFAVRVVSSAAQSEQSEWVHFCFPPGEQFTDGLVTPAMTLQPGVVLELLPDMGSFAVRQAPGPGYLPVVCAPDATDADAVAFDAATAAAGTTAVYGAESFEIWGLDQEARPVHRQLINRLRERVERKVAGDGWSVDLQALSASCLVPELSLEETVARAALDIRYDKQSTLGPYLSTRLAAFLNDANINMNAVQPLIDECIDEWNEALRKVSKPETRERVKQQQQQAAKEASARAEREQQAAKQAAERFEREEAERLRKEEAAEAEAERNRPAPTIQQRRVNEGGQTGFLTITLAWDTKCDLDLHCKLPHGGGTIMFNQKNRGGGKLDIDANASDSNLMAHPVENIFFASKPQSGTYTVVVDNYCSRTGQKVKYQLAVEINNSLHEFHGWVTPNGSDKQVEAVKITIPPGNKGVSIVTKVKASDGF